MPGVSGRSARTGNAFVNFTTGPGEISTGGKLPERGDDLTAEEPQILRLRSPAEAHDEARDTGVEGLPHPLEGLAGGAGGAELGLAAQEAELLVHGFGSALRFGGGRSDRGERL